MYCDDTFSTEQDSGIVISAYQELLDATTAQELLNKKVSGDDFCWGYYLRIENNSENKISLLGRDISLTDTNGRSVSMTCDGFGGMLPELEPGEIFEFEDYAMSRSSAILYGSCRISTGGGNQIKNIKLPVLSLIANDNQTRVLN